MGLADHNLIELLKQLKRVAQYSKSEVTSIDSESFYNLFQGSQLSNEAAELVLRGRLMRENFKIKSTEGFDEDENVMKFASAHVQRIQTVIPTFIRQGTKTENNLELWKSYSLDHLMLYACLFSRGSDAEKASVFLDVVQPQLRGMITLHEPALKNAVKFLCLCTFFWWQYAKEINTQLSKYYGAEKIRLNSSLNEYCRPKDRKQSIIDQKDLLQDTQKTLEENLQALYKKYKDALDDAAMKLALDAVFYKFCDMIFGPFGNRESREQF